jgi:hypothetical protein
LPGPPFIAAVASEMVLKFSVPELVDSSAHRAQKAEAVRVV